MTKYDKKSKRSILYSILLLHCVWDKVQGLVLLLKGISQCLSDLKTPRNIPCVAALKLSQGPFLTLWHMHF